ncbi:MAG: hypothetical protein WC107_01390 [Patescibacteria group bacterium]
MEISPEQSEILSQYNHNSHPARIILTNIQSLTLEPESINKESKYYYWDIIKCFYSFSLLMNQMDGWALSIMAFIDKGFSNSYLLIPTFFDSCSFSAFMFREKLGMLLINEYFDYKDYKTEELKGIKGMDFLNNAYRGMDSKERNRKGYLVIQAFNKSKKMMKLISIKNDAHDKYRIFCEITPLKLAFPNPGRVAFSEPKNFPKYYKATRDYYHEAFHEMQIIFEELTRLINYGRINFDAYEVIKKQPQGIIINGEKVQYSLKSPKKLFFAYKSQGFSIDRPKNFNMRGIEEAISKCIDRWNKEQSKCNRPIADL